MTRDQLMRALSALVRPLSNRIKVLLRRGVLSRVKYTDNVRLIQVKAPGGQALADIEHLEPFGFTSHAKPGAEAVLLSFGGNSSHTVGLLVGDRRYRMVIEEGDVAIYNTNADYLHLKADGTAELKSSTKVIVDSPAVEMTGTLNVAGATTLQSTLDVTDATTLQSTLDVTSDVTAGATIAASGAVSAPSMSSSGAISGGSVSAGGIDMGSHTHQYTDDGATKTTGAPQ